MAIRTNPRIVRLFSTAFILCALIILSACSPPSEYVLTPGYSFRGKTIGLCMVLASEEQSGLDDDRIANRSSSGAVEEGYAEDTGVPQMGDDLGRLEAPPTIRGILTRVHHSDHQPNFVKITVAMTTNILRSKGYVVKHIPVRPGTHLVGNLVMKAMEAGCDILAVESVGLVRSWNVQRDADRGTGLLTASLAWESQVGGMAIINMVMLDVNTRQIVWQHSRREVKQDFLGPLTGELYDDDIRGKQYGKRASAYQTLLYTQSAKRALELLFASAEEGFVPLPDGSSRRDSLYRAARYKRGQQVYVRPDSTAVVWHLAKVVRDSSDGVTVEWAKGSWADYTRRITFARTDVLLAHWPGIVWVRERGKLRYQPFQFRSAGRHSIVRVRLAGDMDDRTFHAGRVGVIPY
jgi:hypothetical protein